MSNKPTPADTVRLGAISAAIWANPTERGTRYAVTFERGYRDAETGHWKSTSNFNRDDLLVLGKVADRAHTRIHELQAQDRAQDREHGGDAEPTETQPQPPAPRAGGTSAPTATQRAARARSRADHAR